jgi:hypothetical protein
VRPGFVEAPLSDAELTAGAVWSRPRPAVEVQASPETSAWRPAPQLVHGRCAFPVSARPFSAGLGRARRGGERLSGVRGRSALTWSV